MGKAFQGVYGAFVNKVGNVVGRVRQGVQVYSIYQPSVANPRTTSQVSNRTKFSLVAGLMSKILPAVKVGFKFLDGYKYGSAFSSALGYNLTKSQCVISGSQGLEIDFAKVVVAEGQLASPFNLQASVDGVNISFTWADNSGIGNALATDKLYCCVYNKVKNESVFNTAIAARSERTATIACPTAWSSNSVEVYTFFTREDGSLVSTSNYAGTFSL